jgi:hypothetical protein
MIVSHSPYPLPRDDSGDPLLTADERECLAVTANLWDRLCRIVGKGPSRPGDLAELETHIHGIEHVIMSKAAARHTRTCSGSSAGHSVPRTASMADSWGISGPDWRPSA